MVWTRPKVVGEPNGWLPIHRCPPRRSDIPLTSLVRTEAFRAVGGFPEVDRAEDAALFKNLRDAGFKFQCNHAVTWEYHFHDSNRSRIGIERLRMS